MNQQTTMTMDKVTQEPPEGKLIVNGGTESAAMPVMLPYDRALAAQAREVTPAQARIEAVANVLHQAYAKASTLVLSPDEVKRLCAPFPDEAFRAGAGGKDNLIYIPHAFIRARLCEALGIGQWSFVSRNRWTEDFMTTGKVPQAASRVYVEGVLLVRGCFVAEAVGDMVYYPKNEATNFGDAVEGAKSAALHRCAKELGVGLQQWDKSFAEGWLQRQRSSGNGPWEPGSQGAPAATAPGAVPRASIEPDGSLSVGSAQLILDGLAAQGVPYADAHRWLLANQWLKDSGSIRTLSQGHAQRILDNLAVFCGHVKAWSAKNPVGSGAAAPTQSSQPSTSGGVK